MSALWPELQSRHMKIIRGLRWFPYQIPNKICFAWVLCFRGVSQNCNCVPVRASVSSESSTGDVVTPDLFCFIPHCCWQNLFIFLKVTFHFTVITKYWLYSWCCTIYTWAYPIISASNTHILILPLPNPAGNNQFVLYICEFPFWLYSLFVVLFRLHM